MLSALTLSIKNDRKNAASFGMEQGRQPPMQHNYATSYVCKINLKNERRKALLVLNLESPLD